MEQLNLIGAGNDGERNFFILSKDEAFLSLFPKFLLGCGFTNLAEYESFENGDDRTFALKPNTLQHFKNDLYDIDVIFTSDKIILIVRTPLENREHLLVGIRSLTSL